MRDTRDRWAVLNEAWRLIGVADALKDEKELQDTVGKLVPMLVECWDLDPYNAMEALEGTALALPLDLARDAIKVSVEAWRKKPNYRAEAGGAAGHCYLSALILSGNYGMAEHPWADKLLEYALGKDTNPDYEPRKMKDRTRKIAFVTALMAKSTTGH